jgi:hypothetical protein
MMLNPELDNFIKHYIYEDKLHGVKYNKKTGEITIPFIEGPDNVEYKKVECYDFDNITRIKILFIQPETSREYEFSFIVPSYFLTGTIVALGARVQYKIKGDFMSYSGVGPGINTSFDLTDKYSNTDPQLAVLNYLIEQYGYVVYKNKEPIKFKIDDDYKIIEGGSAAREVYKMRSHMNGEFVKIVIDNELYQLSQN